jgi:hypothetical protein
VISLSALSPWPFAWYYGYTVFDLGRTELENAGLQRLKKGWGAEEMPLTYSILSAQAPQAMTGKLMPIMQTFIRNSPLWVCRVAGELLYKHFGP